ncbi:MAG: dockerin type I domain-containing protein [Phycisphaerae bacterium]
MKRFAITVASLALVQAALGQGFNIDMNLPAGYLGTGAPNNAFAGAGDQAGFWNSVNNIGISVQLKGLNGSNTAVTMQALGEFIYHDGNSSATGEFAKLLEDTYKLAAADSTFTFTFYNLAAGTYYFYTYGDDPADGTQHTRVTINGGFQSCGGTYGTNDLYSPVSHVRHLVDVDAGESVAVTISNNPLVGGSRGVIGGFQIVPAPTRLYVRSNAPAGGDGLTWATAFQNPGEALGDVGNWGGAIEEIWVAEGTYYTPNVSILGNTFRMVDGVALYGGFNGNETQLAQRDAAANPTFLSGSIGTAALTDNAEHVIMALDCGYDSLIDGFTITGGYAEAVSGGDPWDSHGGGIYIQDSQLTIRNCTLVGNYGWRGGAMVVENSTPRIEDCYFFNNDAEQSGGAIYTRVGGAPKIVGCDFFANEALVNYGGAISNAEGNNGHAVNCRFMSNRANWGGGGVYTNSGNFSVANCTFVGNVGDNDRGGALHSFGDNTYLFITNCTIVGNSAFQCGGVDAFAGANVYVRNSIVYGNSDDDANTVGDREQLYKHNDSFMSVNYCNVQDWSGILLGSGNFGAVAQFIDANGSDNFLGNQDDNLRLLPNSPCIDRGSNSLLASDAADMDSDNNVIEPMPLDLDFNPRRVDDPATADLGSGTAPIVDIGAYEFVPPCDIDGDLDQDGDVDLTDLATLLSNFGLPTGQTRATGDVTGDGAVDLTDLSSLLANYGSVCP